jgi:hypothetical protein
VVLALPLCDRGRLERNSAQQPAVSAADIPQDWIGRNLARKLFSHFHRVSSKPRDALDRFCRDWGFVGRLKIH